MSPMLGLLRFSSPNQPHLAAALNSTARIKCRPCAHKTNESPVHRTSRDHKKRRIRDWPGHERQHRIKYGIKNEFNGIRI